MINNGPGPTYFGVGPTNIGNNPYYNQGIPGYMPGYYNGNYNMYNPYFYQEMQNRQMEEYQKQVKEQQSVCDKISMAINCYNNDSETIEKRLIYSDSQLNDMRIYNQENLKTHMIRRNFKEINSKSKKYIPPKKCAYIQGMHDQKKLDEKIMPKDADLFYFMENGYKINVDNMERELNRQREDLSKLYNQQSYQQLLNMHNNIAGYQRNYDNIQPISLDDMEVSLPSNLRTNQEYMARRNHFIQQVLNKSRGVED